MILSLSPDLVIYLTFCKKAKEKSKEILSQSVKAYFRDFGVSPEEVYDLPSGKPIFASGRRFLSVTHSGDLFAVCFSTKKVGIDAELWREEKERVREKYFFPEEKTLPFSLVWTGKEAVSKISGQGLSVTKKILVSGDKAFFEGKKYALLTRKIRDYRITVAMEK